MQDMRAKILIVDDAAAIRRALRTSIERRTGWKVCGEAENGKMAVDMVRELDPDVVVKENNDPCGLEDYVLTFRASPSKSFKVDGTVRLVCLPIDPKHTCVDSDLPRDETEMNMIFPVRERAETAAKALSDLIRFSSYMR